MKNYLKDCLNKMNIEISDEKLNKFINDYGSFHMTFDTEVEDSFNLFDLLDSFWF